jgi:hypothetical protein
MHLCTKLGGANYIQPSGFETKKQAIFCQSSLLLAGVAQATFAKRGEEWRKIDLLGIKCEPTG